MTGNANLRVLSRGDAVQLRTDLGTAMEKIVSVAAEASDSEKIMAMDALVILQNKRSLIESEIIWAERDAAADGGRAEAKKGGAA